MKITEHKTNNTAIAEVTAEDLIINNHEDGLDLLGNVYYQGFDKVILHSENIAPDFFDLKNGMAGEILQKFSNYRVRLVIVGDFSAFTKQSIIDFIHESNQGKQVNFLNTTEEAFSALNN